MKKKILSCTPLPQDSVEILKRDFEVIELDSRTDGFLEVYETELPSAHGLIGTTFPFSSQVVL